MPRSSLARALAAVSRLSLLLAGALLVAQALATHYPYLSRGHLGMWWADGHYNLLRSFYVANGFRLYSDIPSSHFPGFQLLYAVPLWLLGYGGATPSLALMYQIEHTANVLTGTFQLLLLYAAGWLAGLSRSSAGVLAIFVTYYFWEGHGFNLPLVETLLFCAAPLLVLLLADCLLPAELRTQVRATAWFVSLASSGTVLGLTIAPSLVFWSAVVLAWLAIQAGPASALRHLLTDRWALAPLLAVPVLLLLVLWRIDLAGWHYWTLVHTAQGFRINVLDHLWIRFTRIPWAAFAFGDPALVQRARLMNPLAYAPVMLFLVLAVGMLHARRRRVDPQRPGPGYARYALFALVFLLGYWLVGWRQPTDYYSMKQVPAAGMGLGLILVGLRQVLGPRPVAPSPWPWPRALVALAVSLAVVVGVARLHRPPPPAPRPAAFDAAGVCHFRETKGCRCAIQTMHDPRRFLQFDVQPCSHFPPDHSHVLAHVPRTRLQLLHDTRDPRVAFLTTNNLDHSRMYNVPDQALSAIWGQRSCYRVDALFTVCGGPVGREPRDR